MATIYLAGFSPEFPSIADDFPDHEFLDTFAVSSADGVFLVYDGDSFDAIEREELQQAYDNDIPVVVWWHPEDKSDALPGAAGDARYFHADRDKALKVLLMYAGESAEDVVSK